ncbi:MAG: GGDEF domain-containing protein [Terracidiphilus sp.]
MREFRGAIPGGASWNGDFPLRSLILALVVVASSISVALGAEPGTLTSLGAVHALTNAEASHALPVACEATVVYSRAYENLLFVQDGDAALFVNAPTTAALHPGDRIAIQGKTQASFRPLVVASAITLLQHGALPKPVPATFDALNRAEYDSRLVTVRAKVRAADLVVSAVAPLRSARLQLIMDGGHIEANVDSDDETALKGLLDDEIEITGVAAGKFDDKMQQTGTVLYVSKLADIKTLKDAHTKFWSLPITPMDQIHSSYHVQDRSRRVQVLGTITYYEPGSAVVLQEGSKSLWISTQTRDPLRIGDHAVASGFPETRDRLLTLTDSEILDTKIPAPIKPQPATWEQLALWSSSKPIGHQNDLVSIDGQVVGEVRVASRDEYVLSAKGRLFSAIYGHPRTISTLAPMLQIPLGAKVRVTGICSIDGTAINPGQEVPFDILMRSIDDIEVIARPSLLNVRNLTLLVGLLLVLFLSAGTRSLVIERRVRRQNAAAAYSERRRSRILEDINGSRPLAEILEQITELASFRLRSAPCWCQIVDGAFLGNCPQDLNAFRMACEPIPARSGPPLGTMNAAFDPLAKPGDKESEILSAAAAMATLAIETRRLYSDLQHRSEFDLLTAIHNRFSLENYLDMQIEAARQTAGIFGLIYIDLNDFKQVNDVYGHKVGDMYLQEVAIRMRHQLRPADMLARLGGDEFAVVLPLVHGRREVEEIVQRLEHSFDDPFSFDGYVLQGSASAGIALYPNDGKTRDSLLSAADAAMYVAKQTKKEIGKAPGEDRNPAVTLKDRA